MSVHVNKTQISSTEKVSLRFTMPDTAEQIVQDIQAVNEQLLIAGLREHTLAEQLQHQLAFITAITTSLGEGLCVLDTAGRCTFVNPAAERMLGWTNATLHGEAISVIIPSDVTQTASNITIPACIRDVLSVGTAHRDEDALFMHRDGGLFPAAYSAAPIVTDGQISGAVITFRDITEVRRLERTREEYLALISHDLRTPLTAILARAQLLMRQLTQRGLANEAASANVVVKSSLRMRDMITDLVNRSHAHGNTDVSYRSAVNLVVVVQHMIDQTIAPDQGERIMLDAIPTLPVVVEVAQIERVIVNLLANALKFSAHNTPIVIQVYRHASQAIVAITDRGDGIAADDLPHLFEKHYRALAVGQIAGNGLGLYSSRQIVEAHDGRLWAESTPGVGSTFTLALPLPTR